MNVFGPLALIAVIIVTTVSGCGSQPRHTNQVFSSIEIECGRARVVIGHDRVISIDLNDPSHDSSMLYDNTTCNALRFQNAENTHRRVIIYPIEETLLYSEYLSCDRDNQHKIGDLSLLDPVNQILYMKKNDCKSKNAALSSLLRANNDDVKAPKFNYLRARVSNGRGTKLAAETYFYGLRSNNILCVTDKYINADVLVNELDTVLFLRSCAFSYINNQDDYLR
jgi:hypothetical protein